MSDDAQHVLATADLHFRLHPDGDVSTERLAAHVCNSDAEVLVIAGDVGDLNPQNFASCLLLFRRFKGVKLLVPGNHDLWTNAMSSREKYETLLPQVAEECGFKTLDKAPVVIGRTAFIGSIGWYDYSFRNPRLGLTTEQYRQKVMPGVCTWNDRTYIKWDMQDEEFMDVCLRQLKRHYDEVEPKSDRVVAILHHVPFVELVHSTENVALEFCRAYLGSAQLGDLLLKCPKVSHVVCGHCHMPAACTKGALNAVVVGSDYGVKRLLSLDLRAGTCTRVEFAAE